MDRFPNGLVASSAFSPIMTPVPPGWRRCDGQDVSAVPAAATVETAHRAVRRTPLNS